MSAMQSRYGTKINSMSKLLLTLSLLFSVFCFSIAQSSWTGLFSNDWSDPNNWLPVGVPGAGTDVSISGIVVLNQPQLPPASVISIKGLTIAAGASLDLNGSTLDVADMVTVNTGAGLLPLKSSISNGKLIAGRMTTNNAHITNLDFTLIGGPTGNSTFNGQTTFDGTNVLTNQSVSGADISIASNPTANVVFNGPVTFNRDIENIVISNRGSTTFKVNATFNIVSPGPVNLANQGSVIFNANLIINSSVGGTVNAGMGGGSVTISSGGAMLSSGFTGGGTFNLLNVTQMGSSANGTFMPSNFNATNCNFGGGIAVTAININLANVSFGGANIFESRGSSVSNCIFGINGGATTFTKVQNPIVNWGGGNTYYGDFTFTRLGNGLVNLSNANGSTYYGNATFVNASAVNSLNPLAGAGTTSHFYGNISTLGSTSPVSFGPGVMEINGPGTRQFKGDPLQAHIVPQLVMNTGAGGILQLNVPLQITTQATFTKGVVNSSAGAILLFQASAASNGGSDDSYVDGPVRKNSIASMTAFLFPTGGGGFYAPIAAEAASGTPTFTAQYFRDDPDNGGYSTASFDAPIDHLSKSEYWTLNRNSVSGTASVLLFWDIRSNGVTDPGDLVIARWEGSKWVSEGNSVFVEFTATSGFLVSAMPLNNFSPFTLASITPVPANPLPIELLYFNAKPENKAVKLNWATATERNNAFFSVERSADGTKFESIATIAGAGDSYETRFYETADNQPLSGISYYRLRQEDFDGSYQYSNIATVTFKQEARQNFSFYPNPVTNTLSFQIPEDWQHPTISLMTPTGAQVSTFNLESKSSSWDVSQLQNGLYLLVIRADGLVRTEKIVIQH